MEENLDIVGAGMFGNDTVSLAAPGSGGPTLQKQTVGGIAAQQFWLGMLGVNPKPTNFTNFTTQQPSYMTNLKEQDIIPSISFGYTAGNQYREFSQLRDDSCVLREIRRVKDSAR